jgi:hypothetical protein
MRIIIGNMFGISTVLHILTPFSEVPSTNTNYTHYFMCHILCHLSHSSPSTPQPNTVHRPEAANCKWNISDIPVQTLIHAIYNRNNTCIKKTRVTQRIDIQGAVTDLETFPSKNKRFFIQPTPRPKMRIHNHPPLKEHIIFLLNYM